MGQHLLRVPPIQAEGRDLTAADGASQEDEALEAGRRLFAGEWVFTRACHAVDQLPSAGPPEVAFAGRSNVGKSSLLNALTGRKQLARSSNTPGRTRALNLFARSDGDGPVIVDMPGYGYAKAPKAEVAAWTQLVFDYLRGRQSLRRVFLLIDARHGLKPIDEAAMAAMDEAAVSYQAVLTKADKSRSERAAVLAATEAGLRRRPAAHPEVLITSVETSDGLETLRATIAALSQG
ncbi:ribosome biogenesis GTP-binding protein YihA/YsxC [Acuticoccus sp.]|uniref:ribosome biogenesis GTP-binding protein YihA/YsxC n=1 Tax=Acuticoccus sp. TaxID=1904378 RepID=UPI003B52D651